MKLSKLTYPIISFASTLVIWQSIVDLKFIKSVFLPPPSEVLLGLLKNYEYLSVSILITLKHIIIGYFIGILLAIFWGFIVGWYKNIDLSIKPLLLIISPIPIVTFLPLFILWFGLGITPIILCAVIGSFFPTFTATISGIKKIDKDYIEVAKNFNKNQRQILTAIIFPASLPYITSGFGTSIQLTFLITPVAEMIMGDVGLGGFIWRNADLFKTELVILGQITLGIIGLILFKIFDLIERKYILPWVEIRE